jgi:hypothetical protein
MCNFRCFTLNVSWRAPLFGVLGQNTQRSRSAKIGSELVYDWSKNFIRLLLDRFFLTSLEDCEELSTRTYQYLTGVELALNGGRRVQPVPIYLAGGGDIWKHQLSRLPARGGYAAAPRTLGFFVRE